jgi:spoIIIJ-associated protein
MSSETKDFYGKNVAEAIKKACEKFGVAQENLTIEVLETGSKGIFGLIRQKAHIRAKMQEAVDEAVESSPEKQTAPAKKKGKKKPQPSSPNLLPRMTNWRIMETPPNRWPNCPSLPWLS